MEDKIEVGESIRTRRGEICKILGISPEVRDEKRLYSHKAYWLDNRKGSLTEPYIMKHSKNIIDLIDINDYVNGLIVIGKYFDENNRICLILDTTDKMRQRCYEENIKSIVTKEQFTSMEYKI